MSGTAGLIIGLLVGVILAVGASTITMALVSGDMEERQAEAYDRGYADATSGLPESGAGFSAELNERMMQQNEELLDALDTARTRLQGVQERDDLSPAAREELTRIINDLPE